MQFQYFDNNFVREKREEKEREEREMKIDGNRWCNMLFPLFTINIVLESPLNAMVCDFAYTYRDSKKVNKKRN